MRRGASLVLLVLGALVVAFAAWRGSPWALLGAAGALAAALGWTWWPGVAPRRQAPLALPEVLDLLRRARAAVAGWAVGAPDGEVEVLDSADVPAALRRRGAAIVHLASVDGRVHVVRDAEGTYVAVGDFPYGAGVLLGGPGHDGALTDAVAMELRQLVAGMRLDVERPGGPQAQVLARRLAIGAGGAQTLDGIARAGVELAGQLSQRGAAVVLAATGESAARVLVVSSAADRRLMGVGVESDAAASRAIATGLPVAARAGEDVFGSGAPERRRGEREGTAYPLVDGRVTVGALVLLGPPLDPDAPAIEEIGLLVAELGPRLAAARAVHEAERRAVVDPLTGLRNRREFERTLAAYGAHRQTPGPGGGLPAPPPATLVYVDIDYFKRLNDSLGHPAGDAALKHVARLLEAALRDGDLVARIGGEEFAVWLPRTPLAEGVEVAERIRQSVAGTTWRWSGAPYALTTSCGVAGYPAPIGDLANLPAAADAALYRAKEAGRDRVEKAGASD